MPYNKPATATNYSNCLRALALPVKWPAWQSRDSLAKKPKSNNILAFVIGFSSWPAVALACLYFVAYFCALFTQHLPCPARSSKHTVRRLLGAFQFAPAEARRHLFVCIHKILYS